ncbi:hypothetical protein IQ06DRAFT_337199 [Phaeosphaeriaceae sp. SRC1lsM3a]|nr:hypothetical protein IQ06DRAFT_337199 [Stagonospora sp. SRC1lsM3a]
MSAMTAHQVPGWIQGQSTHCRGASEDGNDARCTASSSPRCVPELASSRKTFIALRPQERRTKKDKQAHGLRKGACSWRLLHTTDTTSIYLGEPSTKPTSARSSTDQPNSLNSGHPPSRSNPNFECSPQSLTELMCSSCHYYSTILQVEQLSRAGQAEAQPSNSNPSPEQHAAHTVRSRAFLVSTHTSLEVTSLRPLATHRSKSVVQPQQVRREPTKVSNSVQTWRMQTFLQGQGIFDLQTLQTRTRASILCNYYFKVSSTRSLTFVRSRDLRFTPNRDEILLQVLPEEAMMFTHDTHRQHSERLQHH